MGTILDALDTVQASLRMGIELTNGRVASQ